MRKLEVKMIHWPHIASKESRFQKPGAQSLPFLPVSPCSLWFLNPSQSGAWSFFSLEGYTQEQGVNSLKTGLLSLGLELPPGCLWLCPHVVLEARPCRVSHCTVFKGNSRAWWPWRFSVVDLQEDISSWKPYPERFGVKRNRKRWDIDK